MTLWIIKEKQQRKGECRRRREGRMQKPRRRWLRRGILAKLSQRMSRAEKLIFFLRRPFRTLFFSFSPPPFLFCFSLVLSVSLFISNRYLQTVLLMKILAFSIPRESECTLPDGSSYSMCLASSSFAGSEKDLRNLGRYFLLAPSYP